VGLTGKGGRKAPRPRSGWVAEDARHTVRLVIRCSPELAAAARELTAGKTTLADVLAAGVKALGDR
jgi:hypothetical protein